MELVGQLLVNTLVLGFIYGLIGLAFTAIYNVSRLINFAQGEFLMLGAFMAYVGFTLLGLPLPLAICLSVVVVAIAGFGLERVVTPLIDKGTPLFTVSVITIAYSQILMGTVGPLTSYTYVRVVPFLGNNVIHLGPMTLLPQQFLLAVVSTVLVVAYWYFLRKTMAGRAMRAIGCDRDMAKLVGIRSRDMTILAFLVSTVMAGIAGFFIAPLSPPQAQMGMPLLMKGFVAAVLGGLGNPFAALVGGFFIAAIGAGITAYVSSAFAEIGIFVVLLIVLMIRPQGFFPERE
jgi:branched-chain amino acid transport system permease protein